MSSKDYTTVAMDFETKDRIEQHKIIDAESFNDCLVRILDDYESEA